MSDTQKNKSAFEDSTLEDFYQLLGVGIDATDEEIEKGYHNAIEIYHLNCPNGDKEMAKKVLLAYETLGDSSKRSVYNVFYNLHINNKEDTQDVSVEPVRDSVPVTEEVSKEPIKSQSVVHSPKKKGTSYHFEVSPTAIRNTLRKNNYSEKTINDFLTWCQEHHMKIANGKELHSVFLKYLSVSKGTQKSVHSEPNVSSKCEDVRYNLKRDHCYQQKRSTSQNTRKKTYSRTTFHFPFHRELKACQKFVKSSIRNLQIFDFQALVTLVHTIQNVTVFFYENKNNYKKRNVKVKRY